MELKVKRNMGILLVLAMAIAVMLWTGARRRQADGGAALTGGASAVKGKAAPDFDLVDIRTGKNVHLSDFKGKAVLLNFWATWCPPCKVEIPWFVDLQKQYGPQGLQVIGVAMDDAGKDAIAKFSNSMGVNYLVLQGTEKVAELYGGVESLPTTFYIGRDGTVTKRVFGLISHQETEESVKMALNSGNATSATSGVSVPPGEPLKAQAGSLPQSAKTGSSSDPGAENR
jgi:cytochrome c biogenesis protein CcmG/thiol:disulfide interchange protein DsbE